MSFVLLLTCNKSIRFSFYMPEFVCSTYSVCFLWIAIHGISVPSCLCQIQYSQTFTHSTLLLSLPDHVKRKRKKKTFVLSSSSLLLYACTEKKKLFFFCIYSFFKLLSIFLSFSLCPWFSHSPPRLYCFLFNLLLYGNSSLFLHPFPHSDFFIPKNKYFFCFSLAAFVRVCVCMYEVYVLILCACALYCNGDPENHSCFFKKEKKKMARKLLMNLLTSSLKLNLYTQQKECCSDSPFC